MNFTTWFPVAQFREWVDRLGCVNAKPWQGHDAGTALVVHVSADRRGVRVVCSVNPLGHNIHEGDLLIDSKLNWLRPPADFPCDPAIVAKGE